MRQNALYFMALFRLTDFLPKLGQIDFNDMISRAATLVETGRFCSPFGYILVDEFQDLSPSRGRLLKALLDQRPGSQLLAVGDDWQSVFRFAGSDISCMTDYRQHFGEYERVDLTTTFRCSDHIASAASKFVLVNPSQIRTEVKSVNIGDMPSVHIGLAGKECPDPLAQALQLISTDAIRRGESVSVMLIGRYRHSSPRDLNKLAMEYPHLNLSFMTAHRSKGLEADYAIVLGLTSGKYGFPTEIADDPILDLVLAAPEKLSNAEERRLLYVAMTRAKRRVFLLAEGGNPSPFVRELMGNGFQVDVFGENPANDTRCPKCVEGTMIRREGPNGRMFYGCSNFPYCTHTRPPCVKCSHGLPEVKHGIAKCPECGHEEEACPHCGGRLVERVGPYGRFKGCSNFPTCTHTRQIQREADSPKDNTPMGARGFDVLTDWGIEPGEAEEIWARINGKAEDTAGKVANGQDPGVGNHDRSVGFEPIRQKQ